MFYMLRIKYEMERKPVFVSFWGGGWIYTDDDLIDNA